MKTKFIYALTAIVFLISSCSNQNDGDIVPPVNNETYIQFVSPIGTNVLDSIKAMPDEEFWVKVNPDLIAIDGKQEKDSEPLEMENFIKRERLDEIEEFKNKGTLLVIRWADWFFTGKNYNNSYEISLRSPKIFGDDDIHILKWYVKVKGPDYDAYKCEFDGKEVDSFKDLNLKKNNYARAVISVVCK